MSEVKVNKLSPRSGTTVTLGDSGDTVSIPSGVTLSNSGTIDNLNASNLTSGTVPDARFPATLPAANGSNLTNITPADDTVTGAKIVDDAIDSEHYTDGSIDNAHIAADAITGAKIADDAIDSEHYTDGSIDNAHIAADAITGAKIADDAISDEHLDPTAITGQTAETSVADNDLVLISDTSASAALKKMTVANLVANAGGGKILQVKSATDTTNRSTNSTSFTNNSSTLSISITPSSTSSKILIMMHISSYEKAGGAHFITIFRGSTNLANNDGFIPNSDSNDNKSSAVVHLDSPNTTSATTYQFRHRSESSGDSQSINGRGGTSNLILMEVGA